MSITREQRDEIGRLVQVVYEAARADKGGNYQARVALADFLDSLVAEPAEQPTMWTQTTTFVDDDARLHADDARAAMAALICEPRWGLSGSEHGVAAAFAHAAHELADAMQAERKRRQG